MLPKHIFQFFHAAELAAWIDDLPQRYGTYIVLIRGGDRLLELAGYFAWHDRLPDQRYGCYHLYTGAGYEWGRRVRHHLTGNTIKSNFRATLDALEQVTGAISRSGIGPWTGSDPDERLTRWMLRNAVIGVAECRDPKTLEKAILEGTPSPLNIDQRRWDPFAQRLLVIRAQARTSRRNECPRYQSVFGSSRTVLTM